MPSGDHAGPSSCSALCVSWTASEPSASMTQISRSRSGLAPATSASDSNAIRAPSGDQAGAESYAPATSKSVRGSPPAASSDLDRAILRAARVPHRREEDGAHVRGGAGIELTARRVVGGRRALAERSHAPDAGHAHGLAAASEDGAGVVQPGRLAGRLPVGREREPAHVGSVRRHPRDLVVHRRAGLADAVGDVAAVGRPVGLPVVVGVRRELPQPGAVVVHREDVAARTGGVRPEARARDPAVERGGVGGGCSGEAEADGCCELGECVHVVPGPPPSWRFGACPVRRLSPQSSPRNRDLQARDERARRARSSPRAGPRRSAGG